MSTQVTTAPSHRRRLVATVAKVALVLVGLAVVLTSWRLGIGTLAAPGPGLWPGVAGVGLAGFATHLLLAERTSEVEALTANSWKVPVGLLSLVVFGIALAYLGLTLPVFVLLLIWLRVLGREPLGLSVLLAAGAAIALHLVFVVALGVAFPPDLLVTVIGLNGA